MFLGLRRSLRHALRVRYAINYEVEIRGQYKEQFAYGHREVLLDYAQMPRELMFKAVIPHGKIAPHTLDPILPQFDLSDGAPIQQLLWRDDSVQDALRAGVKGVLSIGAPFLYALANSGHTLKDTRENLSLIANNFNWAISDQEAVLNSFNKIIYMPIHSWEGDVVSHSIPKNSLLKQLDPGKVTVCLGFLDFCNPNVRRVYEDCGWKLTCAGVRDSMIIGSPAGGRENFLYELREIFSDADAVVANEFTTGLFYAASLGKFIGILQSLTDHELDYSSWNSHETFRDTLYLQRITFPWLYGDKATADKILVDLTNSLGINSFKEPSFFQTEVETLSVHVPSRALR